MSDAKISLWVLGPVGSGKTTLLQRYLPPDFRLLDQDAQLEQELLARHIPLDTRTHDPVEAETFRALRREVSDRVWTQPPGWRLLGVPLAFEVSGDKPHLLQIEVELDRAAGYRSLGVAVRCPLETCLRRNGQRCRVLPDDVVESTWLAFEKYLATGAYTAIFGPSAFHIAADASEFDLAQWLNHFRATGS